mgnify:CR=1 FL=1
MSKNMKKQNKTKVICTIGPKCISVDMMKQMAKAGMKCARINLSHGDFSFYNKVATNLKKVPGYKIPLMTDTKGPEIRVCELKKPLLIKSGATVTILTKVFGLIDGASVITTLGIGGLAISLGAQSLIQDIIGGVFIFLEKQLEVGD